MEDSFRGQEEPAARVNPGTFCCSAFRGGGAPPPPRPLPAHAQPLATSARGRSSGCLPAVDACRGRSPPSNPRSRVLVHACARTSPADATQNHMGTHTLAHCMHSLTTHTHLCVCVCMNPGCCTSTKGPGCGDAKHATRPLGPHPRLRGTTPPPRPAPAVGGCRRATVCCGTVACASRAGTASARPPRTREGTHAHTAHRGRASARAHTYVHRQDRSDCIIDTRALESSCYIENGEIPDRLGDMLTSALRGVIGSAGWLASGSRLLQQGLGATPSGARAASSHAENTNTFLREVRHPGVSVWAMTGGRGGRGALGGSAGSGRRTPGQSVRRSASSRMRPFAAAPLRPAWHARRGGVAAAWRASSASH
jgi:hypothetical protein